MIWFIIVFMPLIVAFHGGDFWAKAGISVQQPQILFTNKFFVNTLF